MGRRDVKGGLSLSVSGHAMVSPLSWLSSFTVLLHLSPSSSSRGVVFILTGSYTDSISSALGRGWIRRVSAALNED